MTEAELLAALGADEPPARDPAFTLRVIEGVGRAQARRDLARRALMIGAMTVAGVTIAPLAGAWLASGDVIGDPLILALGGVAGAMGLARLLPKPAPRR